jgi:RNA polymerase primary sigma factor
MESLKIYLKQIRDIPLLTAQEEITLSRKAKRGDEQARKKMIQSNLRLVISIAKRYMRLGTPFLDLIEEGNLGLMKAVDKFNHRKGFRFSTYAAWWIKQGITRSLSEQGKMIRVPVYMNDIITKWRKNKERLTQKLKRTPADLEIAKKLKIPKEKIEQINFWMNISTSSLDSPIGEDNEGKVSDLIEDETAIQPDSSIEHMLDKERVENLLEIMGEKERIVLDMRFGLADKKPCTLAEVAKRLGVSRERIRQIEEAALRKIRKFVEGAKEEV